MSGEPAHDREAILSCNAKQQPLLLPGRVVSVGTPKKHRLDRVANANRMRNRSMMRIELTHLRNETWTLQDEVNSCSDGYGLRIAGPAVGSVCVPPKHRRRSHGARSARQGPTGTSRDATTFFSDLWKLSQAPDPE
jgi:hypothetical protein